MVKELSDFWKEKLGNNVHNLPEYEFRALRLAEIYGIIDYDIDGNIMTYIEELPTEGTFKHTVDLDTMEETSEQIGPGYLDNIDDVDEDDIVKYKPSIKTYIKTDYGWHNNATTLYGELLDGNWYVYIVDSEDLEIYNAPITDKYIDTLYNYDTDDDRADDEWFNKFKAEHNITRNYDNEQYYNIMNELDAKFFKLDNYKAVEENKVEENKDKQIITNYHKSLLQQLDKLQNKIANAPKYQDISGIESERNYIMNKLNQIETDNPELNTYNGKYKVESKVKGIFDNKDVKSYILDIKDVVTEILKSEPTFNIELPNNGNLMNDNSVITYELMVNKALGDINGIAKEIASKLKNKLESNRVLDVKCVVSHSRDKEFLLLSIIGPDIVAQSKKQEQKSDEQLKVVSYHLEDMGGHTMAVFGKLSDGNHFSGNEEVLSIYDEDIWPLYYDDEDVTEFENNHLIKMIYLDDGVISKEDKELYYNIISQTSFFSEEDLEWLREDKLELDKIEESKTVSQLKQEIEIAIDKVLENEDLTYLPDDIRDYIVVDVKAEDDRIKIEIRAELDYDEIQQLITPLYKVIRKYDSEAYFDMEDVGIAVAYIDNKSKKITETVEQNTDNKLCEKINGLSNKVFNRIKSLTLFDYTQIIMNELGVDGTLEDKLAGNIKYEIKDNSVSEELENINNVMVKQLEFKQVEINKYELQKNNINIDVNGRYNYKEFDFTVSAEFKVENNNIIGKVNLNNFKLNENKSYKIESEKEQSENVDNKIDIEEPFTEIDLSNIELDELYNSIVEMALHITKNSYKPKLEDNIITIECLWDTCIGVYADKILKIFRDLGLYEKYNIDEYTLDTRFMEVFINNLIDYIENNLTVKLIDTDIPSNLYVAESKSLNNLRLEENKLNITESEETEKEQLENVDNIIDTEKELVDGIKKEIYQYTKQQGLDIEKLRKQGIELESIADVVDKVVGNMVSKSAIEYMDKTNKDITWDFNIENNDIQIIID